MGKSKKNSKAIQTQDHPCIKMLNCIYHNHLKPLMNSDVDIYGLFEEQHIKGKAHRPSTNYLTCDEVDKIIIDNLNSIGKQVLSEKTALQRYNELLIPTMAILGWKQFMQVYTINSELLEELRNIDFSDEKFASITKEEVEFLPCHNFFVEYPIKIKNVSYAGFFVFFGSTGEGEPDNQLQILFTTDYKDPPVNEKNKANGYYVYVDTYHCTLLYSNTTFIIQATDRNETITVNPDAFNALKLRNHNTFNDLGDEKAIDLLCTLSQIVSYLSAMNLDLSLSGRRTKKLEKTRTHNVDGEIEKWVVGSNYKRNTEAIKNTTKNAEKKEPKIVDGAFERVILENNYFYETSEKESLNEGTDGGENEHIKGYHQRPHMRRAHWAYYWYGKKDGSEERVRRRKFISAIFINNTGEEATTPTREKIKYRF